MSTLQEKLSKFSIFALYGVTKDKSSMRFRAMLYCFMVLIVYIPLIFTTIASSVEYGNLLLQEEQDQLYTNAQGAKKILEIFMEELTSSVIFVSEEYSYEDLLDQSTASTLLVRLKKLYGGIVDLGVIDNNGIQKIYAGPFRLNEYDYSDQEWYNKVLVRRVHISEMFMGFRRLPHFVISVSHKLPGRDQYWVLRISIDGKTLEKYIATITTHTFNDIFLINHSGILQTDSDICGNVLEKCPLFVRPAKNKITVGEIEHHDIKYLKATVYIEGTPWILGLFKESYMHGEQYASFCFRLKVFFIISAALALVIIVLFVNLFANHLQKIDKEREIAMREAEHTGKLASIGRLAAGVAHEINNPLAIIDQKAGLMTDLIDFSEDFKYKDKFSTSIEGILDAVERCKVITHRLLGFARRMDVAFEHINVNDLLREVLGFLEKEALYSHINLELSLADDLPTIFSDRGQLQQIFLNIVNNGIDAIGEDGDIVLITSQRDEETIEVQIQDSGPGIPPELITRIFDPFFTTKEAGKGTGLGLSITYGLIKKLDGNISVQSEVGKGTTFTVSLPINKTREGGFT
ncbi:MAG: ATP-binding protein [Thermodesulfobacteriota bacterium]|nr:ATP-binding protein [Thermodesulfobacteriota bacterium]